MSWIVYILQCADKSLYTGITNNLESRRHAHDNGTGAKYTKGRGPVCVIYHEEYNTRSDAAKRESAIKKLTRAQKLTLCGLKRNV